MIANHFERHRLLHMPQPHGPQSEPQPFDVLAALTPPQNSLVLSTASDEGGFGSYAVYYINTEGPLPILRLKQILLSAVTSFLSDLLQKHTPPHGAAASAPWLSAKAQLWTSELLNFIFIEHIAEDFQLWDILCTKLTTLSANFEVKLIVIDSIAALFRVLGNSTDTAAISSNREDYALRAVHLFRTSALLRRVATETDCWIVCTNQVTSDFNATGASRDSAAVKPALGLAWANCVNCRVVLGRVDRLRDPQERSFKVEFAPHVPPSSCYFRIEPSGIMPSAIVL